MGDKNNIDMLEATINLLIAENERLNKLLEEQQRSKNCQCHLCTYVESIEK